MENLAAKYLAHLLPLNRSLLLGNKEFELKAPVFVFTITLMSGEGEGELCVWRGERFLCQSSNGETLSHPVLLSSDDVVSSL